jgi:hypothetical protein
MFNWLGLLSLKFIVCNCLFFGHNTTNPNKNQKGFIFFKTEISKFFNFENFQRIKIGDFWILNLKNRTNNSLKIQKTTQHWFPWVITSNFLWVP